MRFHLVILAAGLSRRYGTEKEDKLLADLDGKPMYRHVTDRLLALKRSRTDIADLTIVTRRGPICDACSADPRINCLENSHPERGIASSLQEALSVFANDPEDTGEALVCFVGDQPRLQTSTIKMLLDGFLAAGKPMAAIRYQGASYNPCIFRSDCWDDLRKLSGDTGGKQLIRRHPEDVYYLDLPDNLRSEIEDIDYKQDQTGN